MKLKNTLYLVLFIAIIFTVYGFLIPDSDLNVSGNDYPYCDYKNDTIYFTDTIPNGLYNFHQKGKVLMDKPTGSLHVRSFSLFIPKIKQPTKLNFFTCNALGKNNVFIMTQIIYNDLGNQTQVAFNAENIHTGKQVKDPIVLDYEIWGVRE